jgi:predicted PurR-regulated permease PerM
MPAGDPAPGLTRGRATVSLRMLDHAPDAPGRAATSAATWILVLLTGIVLYLCWTMLAPFVSVLTWALALAIVANPLRRALQRKISNTSIASVIVLLAIVAVALPVTLLSSRLMHEILRGQQALRAALQAAAWQQTINAQPWLHSILTWVQDRVDFAQLAQQLSAAAAARIAPAVSRSALLISEAAMALFVLFFFVRDQEALLDSVRKLMPMTGQEIDIVWERVSGAIRASFYGRVIIGAVQGALGGVIFFALGLPAPLFWSVVMALLSMLPVVGAFCVWLPAAAFLLITGHWIRALILVIYAVSIIHTADNILYPLLVGPRMGLHPLVLLIAFLGGLIAFGAAGLILGPAIVALALALGDIWSRRAVA